MVQILFTRNSDMKRFIAIFVLYVLFVFSLLAAMGSFMYGVEKRAYYNTLKLTPEDRYIAICDSRSEQSLDLGIIKGLKNISLSGSQIAVWVARLKDLVELNRDNVTRTVIIEVNPLQIYNARAHLAKAYEYDRAILWMLHPELCEDAKLENLYFRYIKNEFPIRLLQLVAASVRKRSFRSTLEGSFRKPPAKSGYSESEIQEMAVRLWSGFKDFEMEADDMFLLDCTQDLCKMKGWRLVVMTLPIFGFDPAANAMRNFRRDIYDWCQMHNIRYFDLTGLCGNINYWIDGVHVNCLGARTISEKINNMLLNEL